MKSYPLLPHNLCISKAESLISHASEFSKPGFKSTWTVKFRMFKLDLEKVEEPEIKLPTSVGSSKKWRRVPKNIYFCFIDCAKGFDCVDYNKVENS